MMADNGSGLQREGQIHRHGLYDAEIVRANLLDNDPRKVSDRITACALYMDPPLGRAGFTEEEFAKAVAPRGLAGGR